MMRLLAPARFVATLSLFYLAFEAGQVEQFGESPLPLPSSLVGPFAVTVAVWVLAFGWLADRDATAAVGEVDVLRQRMIEQHRQLDRWSGWYEEAAADAAAWRTVAQRHGATAADLATVKRPPAKSRHVPAAGLDETQVIPISDRSRR